ncbi:MAG: ATP-dependent zinc metalloprotease FtsH [Holosporales bacterium]|nr:ATP-dependent zinc metalloprotease FtsH [Holosporales bacterium]
MSIFTFEGTLSPSVRNFLIWSTFFLTLFVGVNYVTETGNRKIDNVLSYSHFMDAVNSGRVTEAVIQGANIFGKTTDGKDFSTCMPYHNPGLLNEMMSRGVNVSAKPVEQTFSFWGFIIPWIPLIFLIALVLYSFRQVQSRGDRAIGFGKSSAKIVEEKNVKTTFDDVAGVEEAKKELQEIVEFLKNPSKFQKLGGKIPKGVLLIGPPGTGKTLLARAVAGEAGVPFYSIAGSDFVEMFVGVGASRVRDLFAQARKHSPSIIFVDEIDAVGRDRSKRGIVNEEREQTLNQMLVEMDGFDDTNPVIILAATNRAEVLDAALLRAGRFDRRVVVPLPDLQGRVEILNVHIKKVLLDADVDINILARGTPGFSGADLAGLVNEAALVAAQKGTSTVRMTHFEYAKDKVMMGSERRSRVMTESVRKLTAFHEAGHAVVSIFTPGSDPIHKATIIPRGETLGMVVSLPNDDQFSISFEKLIATIMMTMGGKIAEQMVFGPTFVTTGAASDIRAATDLARKMVTEWGMSERLGFQYCDSREPYYGTRELSEHMSKIVDEEVSKLITDCYEKTIALLKEHVKQLYDLAGALLDRETLSGEEVQAVCNGELLRPIVQVVEQTEQPADEKNEEPIEYTPPKRIRKKRESPREPKDL